MGLYNCLTFNSRSASRMFEIYCFIKELHDEIDCSVGIVCRMLNFLLPLERALFVEIRSLRSCRNFIYYFV